MIEARSRSQLVVVGCSAGGIEALCTLVSTLRAPCPAPIVIAQHLDPRRPSHLGDVLSRRTELPVRSVASVSPLEDGVVYVVPAGRDVEITDHELRLLPESAARPKPSVDTLFHTAAEVFGENLIAVVLTGNGSDGSAGARHVKKCGGTVVIENPDTAKFPSMPESLAPTTVDIVADLARIGSIVSDLLAGSYVEPPPDDDRRFHTLLELVRERSGVDFKNYKQATILRRLRRRMVATDTASIDEYARYLAEHPEEYQRLVNSFLIKVTEFMRDPELFAHLRDVVLPALIAHARTDNKSLRIWSAGCATGEEAYSLAILVSELLGDELDSFHVRIFSTDLDSQAVAFARRGIYGAAAVQDLPPELVARHFVAIDGHYQVKKRIRNLTVFGEHDLGQRAPFPHLDLVLCRNVLIYFTSELQRRTLHLFAFSLREGGYLVLGMAETTSPLNEYFVANDLSQKVYLRRGERILVPPSAISAPAPPRRAVRGKMAILPQHGVDRELPRARMSIDALLSSFHLGIVLVDSRYDILEINFVARRLLGIHGTALGQDLVHLAQAVPHRPLLDALDAALRGELSEPIEVAIEPTPGNDASYIQVTCRGLRPGAAPNRANAALIVVEDVTEAVRRRTQVQQTSSREAQLQAEVAAARAERERAEARFADEREQVRRENEALSAAFSRLEATRAQDQTAIRRLTEQNRQLLRANEELAAAHEQLRAVNEELMVSTEEAQAAMEEVETLNEEFQATNEELETVNEELQATIEELNTTNADLEARSREIQEFAAPIEAERARLSAILRSMGDALLVVDGAGRPLVTNDAYKATFGAGRIMAHDEKGRPLLREETPEQRAARGERFQMEFTAPGPGGATRHFEATGHPIGDSGAPARDAVERGVIVIRDITERSLRKLQERFMAMASHELRTPLVPLRGYLDMLISLLPADGDPRLHRFALLARTQTERLDRLVGDLVSATRIQTGKFELKLSQMELVPLVTRAAQTAQTLAPAPEIHLDLPSGVTEPLVVKGDPARLEQVLMNLLGNAFRHADGTPRVDVRLRHASGAAEIDVEDYGPGIPAADVPHVFSSFYQVDRPRDASSGGMGLGLFICREIVTAHGGAISVRSSEGKGATFTIRLPLMSNRDARD
ncbi:CheR family methyltransferase [Sorangium sp. So ce1099]|uniref:CheR family methyltransferase n=1 Tax=Sorangium sp. So ce1099 TaxID=3133331 RepID=UPI003F629755